MQARRRRPRTTFVHQPRRNQGTTRERAAESDQQDVLEQMQPQRRWRHAVVDGGGRDQHAARQRAIDREGYVHGKFGLPVPHGRLRTTPVDAARVAFAGTGGPERIAVIVPALIPVPGGSSGLMAARQATTVVNPRGRVRAGLSMVPAASQHRMDAEDGRKQRCQHGLHDGHSRESRENRTPRQSSGVSTECQGNLCQTRPSPVFSPTPIVHQTLEKTVNPGIVTKPGKRKSPGLVRGGTYQRGPGQSSPAPVADHGW